jgi:HEAT repeat protein
MRPILFARLRVHRPLLVLAVVVLPRLAAAADPLEEFTQLLRQTPERPNKEQLKVHKNRIEKAAAALVRPSDLRRALLLWEWREAELPQEDPDGEENPFAKTYQKIRGELAERLKTSLREGLGSKEAGRRLAVLTFLASMASAEAERAGAPIREEPGAQRIRFFRFTPSMAADVRKLLVADKDAEVRAAAAESVATIDPARKETLEALKPLLDLKREPIERRAAAQALGRMVRAVSEGGFVSAPWRPRPGTPPGVAPERPASALERMGPDILAACAPGLGDEDATVRRLCMEAIRQAAQALAEPLGKWGELIRPLARAVNARTKDVRGRLADKDLSVCLTAHQALEAMATARRSLRGGPRLPPWRGGPSEPPRPADRVLLDGILEALPELEKSLSHEEVRVRLASLYVLETLDADAAPAAAVVAKALADKNGFVRWGAVRVLHNMAPQAPDKAVPALAGALKDDNKTVRLTAANALCRYGPKASEAVGPLGAAVSDTEPHVRLGAIDALAAIGEKAAAQTGVLIRALKDDKTPEARAAAAKALGRLGALTNERVKALRFALRDPDAAVRQAAGDALLDNPG